MLDSKYLRYHLDEVVARLKTRGFTFDQDLFLHLESQRKALQLVVQDLQQESNTLAKQLGKIQRSVDVNNAVEKDQLLIKSRHVSIELQSNQNAFQEVKDQLDSFLLKVPNLPDVSVPLGYSSADNVQVRLWGEQPVFDFTPKNHVQLSVGLQHAMDFERGVVITGSRFVVLRGLLARLQRALMHWMLDVHTQNGYTEVAVPYLVNRDSLQATGQLPFFEEDLFRLYSPDHWYLIPTGEVPLTNLSRNHIFTEEELPLKYVAYTPCFRSEAGSYGKDVKGMIRQHQFDKVELIQFTTAEKTTSSLESLTQSAEIILQQLKLPYRVMELCTGDLGSAASKTYDLEVWLPGQALFREVSSCSSMGDFQARRLKARWRSPQMKETRWIHTLNGSGLAIGRTLVAVLENYQNKDGSIRIPAVLQPYMGGISIIPPLT